MLDTPPLAPAIRHALTSLGSSLRDAGYRPRAVAQALGILAWNGPDLDADWWARDNLADGRLGALVDLLIRGQALPRSQAERVLPPDAWRTGLLLESHGDVRADGVILPIGDDLLWTDRGDRSFLKGGLFLPDSTSLCLRRCLPPGRVGRHLDIGSGGGAVTAAAARRSDHTLALDINPRGALAVQRTMALTGLTGVRACTGSVNDLRLQQAVDRLTFVLPILVPWYGMAEIGPIHTISASSELLVNVLALLPTLLAPGGLALLYCQDWVGGGPVPDAISAAMGSRTWRGAFWWDTEGSWKGHRIRTGCLAIQADGSSGWTDQQNRAPDMGVDDWWPYLGPILGAPPTAGS